MPEGDTVWRTARSLDRALAGKVLTRTDFRVPQLAEVDLQGATVLRTLSRGKHLLTHIEGHQPWTLHTHLKMEGEWVVHLPSDRWRRPAEQARVVLSTADRIAVGFQLGTVEMLLRTDAEQALSHLGPDLLGPDWDETEALRRLLGDPERAVGDALLDQTCLAGIGNIYRSELCFTSGVLPATPVGEVPDLLRLVRRAKAMLEANKERAQQTTTGDLRPGRRTWVYNRAHQPCLRCDTPVETTMQGAAGRERATYWCPNCQR